MTNNYEVFDVLEVGNAGSMIKDKPEVQPDEFIGPGGPDPAYVDNDE